MPGSIFKSIGIAIFNKKELTAENKGEYKTSLYQRNYQKKRNEEFDKIMVEFPLGTKNQIKELLDEGECVSHFIKHAVQKEIQLRSNSQQLNE